jgi:hypothetical protein
MVLDVFFITNGEANADENWTRLKQLCPRAQRLDGVQGLYQAHQACALASLTENFWVVDADAWILDGFDFAFEPDPAKTHWGVAEPNCVMIWPARNPVNGLEYGYGGVKLFPRQPFVENRPWNIDLSTTISDVVLEMSTVSCETRFNATPESAWIGAFRECAKLSSLKILQNRIKRYQQDYNAELDRLEAKIRSRDWNDQEKSNHRLAQRALIKQKYRSRLDINNYWPEIDQATVRYGIWTQYGYFEQNGPATISGARAGVRYGLANANNDQALSKINDWSWLRRQFEIGS